LFSHAGDGHGAWIATNQGQRLTFEQPLDCVELQDSCSHLANVGSRFDSHTVQLKVIAPSVYARIEESAKRTQLGDRSNVGSLGPIAEGTNVLYPKLNAVDPH
jgi:hypothetical protein